MGILSGSSSAFISEWQFNSQIPFKLIIRMQLFVQCMPFKLRNIFPQNTAWHKTDLNLEIKIKRVITFSYILLIRIFNLIKEVLEQAS